MINAAMSFDGLRLRYNPAVLRISDEANVKEYNIPGCQPTADNLGRRAKIIRGEGELCGKSCMEQYRALEAKYSECRTGLLCLPRMQPLYACLTELSITAQPQDNILQYGFTFTETGTVQRPRPHKEYYLTKNEDESLWDISFDSGKAVEELVRLNPHIPYINHLRKGERIRLC